jgi:hypothetical protein
MGDRDDHVVPDHEVITDRPVVLRRGVFVWLLIMSLLSPMIVAVGGVWYTGHVQAVNDRQWCELFATLDIPVPAEIRDPVQRARSEHTVMVIHRLRINKGCIER